MIDQIILAVLGVSAVHLSLSKNESHRKWAPVLGIINQPFWMYATWQAEQWGIFFLSFVYGAVWLNGIRVYWSYKFPVLKKIKIDL